MAPVSSRPAVLWTMSPLQAAWEFREKNFYQRAGSAALPRPSGNDNLVPCSDKTDHGQSGTFLEFDYLDQATRLDLLLELRSTPSRPAIASATTTRPGCIQFPWETDGRLAAAAMAIYECTRPVLQHQRQLGFFSPSDRTTAIGGSASPKASRCAETLRSSFKPARHRVVEPVDLRLHEQFGSAWPANPLLGGFGCAYSPGSALLASALLVLAALVWLAPPALAAAGWCQQRGQPGCQRYATRRRDPAIWCSARKSSTTSTSAPAVAGRLKSCSSTSSAITRRPELRSDDRQFRLRPEYRQGSAGDERDPGVLRFVGGKLSKHQTRSRFTAPPRRSAFAAASLWRMCCRAARPKSSFSTAKAYGQRPERLFAVALPIRLRGRHQRLWWLPRQPARAPPGATVAILSQLDGRNGSNGGATTVPTNATVANSGIPNTVSNNITASIQQAVQNSPTIAALPPPTVAPPQIPTSQVQVASSQTRRSWSSPTPPTPPQPVVIQIAGLVKVAPVGSSSGIYRSVGNGADPLYRLDHLSGGLRIAKRRRHRRWRYRHRLYAVAAVRRRDNQCYGNGQHGQQSSHRDRL